MVAICCICFVRFGYDMLIYLHFESELNVNAETPAVPPWTQCAAAVPLTPRSRPVSVDNWARSHRGTCGCVGTRLRNGHAT